MVEAMRPVSAPARAGDPDVVLRTAGLSKRFGKRLAVDAIDLEVRRGRVYGFLGPNGAGKTTTISMLLGLSAPSAGYAELFGLDARTHLAQALRRTGSVLEGQAYFPHLSARDNLRLWAKISGDHAASRIDQVIETVGLTSRRRDKVRTYSQGMKQRLGLAAALLHDPELIVLDEPTNGLDPAGMREFRELIRELGGAGKTVFVSSHLLGEVEQTCDDVGILKEGRLLRQCPVASLRSDIEAVELRCTDAARARAVLGALPWIAAVREEGGRIVVEAPAARTADVSRALAEAGIYLLELRPRESSLEEAFLEITGEAVE